MLLRSCKALQKNRGATRMAVNGSRYRRPVRFNRTRASQMQRSPIYHQSHAETGNYWRIPEVQGYLMGREVGSTVFSAIESLGGAYAGHGANRGSAH